MPTYGFKCKECGEEWEKSTLIRDRDEEQECPECKCFASRRLFEPGRLADPIAIGVQKPSKAFQDKMKAMKEYYPDSTVRTDW